MIKITMPALVAIVLGLPVAPAQAQIARTFVSAAIGNDGNDCSRLTPCRTFQRAHDATLGNGEITVLDPGGYGAVTITKTISIINDGVGEAGVLVSGGLAGVTVNAGANDAVSLRGLTFKGIGYGGGRGIEFYNGKSLTVENCTIRNLTGDDAGGHGIAFYPRGSSRLAVSNTLIADNSFDGIFILPVGPGDVLAVLNRVELYNNYAGLAVFSGIGRVSVAVADSVAANNITHGVAVSSDGVQPAPSLMVARSLIAGNDIGLSALRNANLRIGQSMVVGNRISWEANYGAFLRSYGDNEINNNLDGNPAPLTIAKK